MRRKIIHFTQHNSFSLSSLKLNKIVIISSLVILIRHLKLWYGNQTWVLFQGGSLCTALSVSKPQCVQFLVPCSKVAGSSTRRVFEIRVIFQLSDGVSQPRMFVGALYFLDSFMSMQSLTDSDKKSIFDATIHPCRQDSLYLQCSIEYGHIFQLI